MSNIPYMQDYNLVHRRLTGDLQAGEELFLPTIQSVRRYVQKHTAHDSYSPDDREDIVQKSMYECIKKLDRYNGACAFSTYAIGFVRNCIMQKRAEYSGDNTIYLESGCLDELPWEDQNVQQYHSPSQKLAQNPLDIVITQEQLCAVEQAFQALKEEYCQVIILRLINKVPVKKVATLTGKTEAAVDSLYRRALNALQKKTKIIYNKSDGNCPLE